MLQGVWVREGEEWRPFCDASNSQVEGGLRYHNQVYCCGTGSKQPPVLGHIPLHTQGSHLPQPRGRGESPPRPSQALSRHREPSWPCGQDGT